MFNEQRRGPAVIFWLILLYIFILACSASIWTCWNSFRDFLCRQIQISWLSSFWMAVFVEESNSNKDSPKQNQGFLFLSCVSLIKVIWVIIKGRSRTDKCWINNVFKRLKVKAFLNMLYLVGPHFAPKTVSFCFLLVDMLKVLVLLGFYVIFHFFCLTLMLRLGRADSLMPPRK